MEPSFETATRHSALEAFGFAFKWWLLIFINVLVPLDFLYRSGTLFNAYSALQIIKGLSTIVIFFTILALAISSISSALALLCNKFSHHGDRFVNKANAISGLLLATIILSDYIWKWTKAVFEISGLLYSNYLSLIFYCSFLTILIVGIVLLWNTFKNKIYAEIKSISKSLFKINAIVVTFCLVYAVAVSFNHYADHKGNHTIPLVHNNNPLKAKHNIILITFDALTAAHTSLHGYPRQTTPNLNKLGQESYVFDNMYSSSNWTLPSLASLMTGKYPTNHRVNGPLLFFPDEIRTQNLAFLLKKLGYETALVWANGYASPFRNNLRGFDKVLPDDTRAAVLYQSGLGPNPWLNDLIDGSIFYRIIGLIFRKIEKSDMIDVTHKPEFSFAKASELLADLREPFFLWVHILPPHAPYLPGDGFLYSILKERVFDSEENLLALPDGAYTPESQPQVNQLSMRYDEHICYADHEFGKFLSFLSKKGLIDNSVLIISSDHGEIFERGFWGHGGSYLYQPLIHVPLVMHLPGQTRGQRIGANVSHADIAPTILDLLGQTLPDWMDGRSFKQTLTDINVDTGTKFSMNLGYVNNLSAFKTRSIAAIKENYKLIKYLDLKRYELYNLKNDVRERNNLISSEPEILTSLKEEIDRILARY